MEKSWDHDLNLSIHCYYVGEHETGNRACERIFSSDAPDHIKYNALQNLTYYTKPLSHNPCVKYFSINTSLKQDGWSLFNPTIINYKNNLLALVRSSNYFIDHNGRYVMPPSDHGVIKTNYIQILMSYDGDVIEEKCVSLVDYPKTNYPVDGLEDLRIFTVKDKYYVSGTMRNMAPFDGTCRIAVAEYDPVNCNIFNMNVIDLNNGQHEKNWMPILESESVKWLYHSSVNNNTVTLSLAENNLQLEHIECSFRAAKGFRGGSQLVKIKNNYYSIIHEAVSMNNKRTYLHRLVEWDSGFKLLRYSKAFTLKENSTIEFCAGMCAVNNIIYISFGLRDAEAYVACLSMKDFESIF